MATPVTRPLRLAAQVAFVKNKVVEEDVLDAEVDGALVRLDSHRRTPAYGEAFRDEESIAGSTVFSCR